MSIDDDLVVHGYEEIDPAKVFDALAPVRADVVAYVQVMEAYLRRPEGS